MGRHKALISNGSMADNRDVIERKVGRNWTDVRGLNWEALSPLLPASALLMAALIAQSNFLEEKDCNNPEF